MRVGVKPLLGIAQADLAQQVEHARGDGVVVHAVMHAQHLADLLLDRVQRVERRHRLLEDDGDLSPRICIISVSGAARMLRPSSTKISPVGCERRGRDSERRMESAETVLPEPDSPTSATVSPADREGGAVDGARLRFIAAGATVKVAHVDEGVGWPIHLHGHAYRLDGSDGRRTYIARNLEPRILRED